MRILEYGYENCYSQEDVWKACWDLNGRQLGLTGIRFGKNC